MDKFIELLVRNPLIALILGGWLVGAVGNAIKSQRKVRDRQKTTPKRSSQDVAGARGPLAQKEGATATIRDISEQAKRRPEIAAGRASSPLGAATAPQPKTTPATSARKSPEQIAAEMRRIFGLEPKAPEPARPTEGPAQVAEPSEPPPPRSAEPAARSRASRSVESTYETTIAPHVGERARERHLKKSAVGQTRGDRGAIGSLGGRARVSRAAATVERRFPLGDLRRVIVMNEILSPPVSMRGEDPLR